MRYYRVHVLDHSSRIMGGFNLHCADHQTACKEAARLCGERQWELWSGDERIHCETGKAETGPET